jgi:hypothetical protein
MKELGKVSVLVEKTIQQRNFEPLKLSIGQEVPYDPVTDDPSKIRRDLKEVLFKEIDAFIQKNKL